MAWRPSASTMVQTFEAKLRKKAVAADIFGDLTGLYSFETKSVPMGSIVAQVKPKQKGSWKQTITLLNNLSDAPTEGRDDQMGNEEDFTHKFLTVYAHNYSHAVPTENYGLDEWTSSAYNILDEVTPALGLYHKEIEGQYKREALCERYSGNLTKAPVSLTQEINSNVFICGVPIASQPAFSNTPSTWAANIEASATAAPTTSKTDNQLNSLSKLNQISYFASHTKLIEPLMLGGKSYYVLSVPSDQMLFLMDPNTSTSFAAIAANADTRGPGNLNFSQTVIPYGNLLIVSDDRYPTASINITASTVSFGYKGAGTTDGRAAAGTGAGTTDYTEDTHVWSCGFLMGPGALFQYDLNPLHYEEETQNYGQVTGIGAFRTTGWQLAEYDAETPSDSTRLNQSSILCLFKS